MDFPDLAPIADRAALYATIGQMMLGEHLDETLGEYRWDVDLAQHRLTFSGDRGSTTVRADMIASLAPGPRSMLWGWAHPQAGDGPATLLRQYGEQHGVVSLTSPEVPLVSTASGDDLVAEIADATHVIGRVAIAVTGVGPYYSGPAGGGSRALFLLSEHDFPTPRIDASLTRLLMTTIQSTEIRDHRNAVHFLAERSGWQLSWTESWNAVAMHDPVTGNGAQIAFDEMARIARLTGDLTA